MRVSDAERSQVADALSKHFAEGRLDQTEFDERMQRAMAAKTRADLAGLFDDLPPLVPEGVAGAEFRRRRRGGFALVMVTALIFLAALSSAVWAWHFPWLLFGLIFFLVWRRSRWGWHRARCWGWYTPVPRTEGEHVAPGAGAGAPPWVYGRRRWWL
jgi:hypothetical protein